ncbi:TMEM175 family protein [Streptomyces sp. ODS05-4]|uniref:TMEM175 family protein n=1 Tax=Streptomyces sp. ODS05-4 TaxID=2944939 RepID=UPI0021094435|nr:TMEM175 family protein [Streptomyces sp. ODS05-4]
MTTPPAAAGDDTGALGPLAHQGTPERLTALSDGIFSIAMTLLVLDVRVDPGLDGRAFHQALADTVPNVLAYALSFAILGGFWRSQRRILAHVHHVDGTMVVLTLAELGAVALLPFPTSLLSEYPSQSLAVALYSAAIALIALLHMALWVAVWKREHLRRLPVTDRTGRWMAADMAATVLVAGAGVPIAFASPQAAMWSWLALWPLKAFTGRRLAAA